MIIYLSGLDIKVLLEYLKLFPGSKLYGLRSFGRPSGEHYLFYKKYRDILGGLVLDSGVFTLVHTLHHNYTVITLSGYISYVLEFGKYFDFYFNFDDDFSSGGFDNNWSNQLKMEEAGLHPVPVLHDITGPEADFYIDKGYKIVAIGSQQSMNLGKLTPVVEKLHDAGIKVHLFGVTKYNFLSSLPIYSCDSSTWTQAGDRGYILYWNSQKRGADKTDKICLPDYKDEHRGSVYFNDYEYKDELKKYLETNFGISYLKLLGYNSFLNRRIVNTHFFVELEKKITEEHLRKGFFTENEL